MSVTRRQLALKYLRRKLERGEFPPGARLSDLALAKEMGVSRTPVREAIQLLVAEGIAEARPHAGVFLRRLRVDDIRELYELREALEGFAAAQVALKAESLPMVIEKLHENCRVLREMEEETKKSGVAQLTPEQTSMQREIDLEFHRTLIDACGNTRIARAVDDSAVHTRLFAGMPASMAHATLHHARLCHTRILSAIVRQDPDAARAEMAAHIRRGMEGRLAEWSATEEVYDLPPPLRDLVDD